MQRHATHAHAHELASYAALALYWSESIVLGPGAAFTALGYSSNVLLTLLSALRGVIILNRRRTA